MGFKEIYQRHPYHHLLFAFALAGGPLALWVLLPDNPGNTSESDSVNSAESEASQVAKTPPGTSNGRAEAGTTGPVVGTEVVLAQFENWTTRYLLAVDPAAQRDLVAEGEAIARQRRTVLHELIARDPEAALAAAVRWPVRAHLPAAIFAWLETPVHGMGAFRVIAALPDGEPAADFKTIRREAVVGGERYEAHTYGRRAGLASRESIAIHGIAIGERLALLDSPARVLDLGEPTPANRVVENACPVSGDQAGPHVADAGGTPGIVVDTGDRIVRLCCSAHVAAYTLQLSENENGNSSSALSAPAADLAYTTGTKQLLFIRMRFSDQSADFEPQTFDGIEQAVAEVNAFYAANSHGSLQLTATITPVYTLPQTAQWYQETDTSGYAYNVLAAARTVAANPASAPGNAGLTAFDYLAYDFEVARYKGGPGTFSGQAQVGLRGTWMKVDAAGVLAHEFGHNLGLWHANAWVPEDPLTIVGPGQNSDYADGFDTMSRNSGAHWHFNVFEKHQLGWLPAEAVSVASGDGRHRIAAHDVAAGANEVAKLALKVRRDNERDYWFEFRQHDGWSTNPWIMNGLGVRWSPWLHSNGGTQLLDTTPLTTNGNVDSAIVIGRTYSDPVANVHVTPIAKAGTQSESIDVDVFFGTPAGNRAPVASLSVDRETAAVGEAVNLRVTGSDADGDELAYDWDFGDRNFGANRPAVVKSWDRAGEYRIRVVVSDKKGETASASVAVTIGAVSGTQIHGTVRDADGNPVADVRVDNGLSIYDRNHRAALTDSDGSWFLTDLPAGEWTLQARKPGWTFAAHGFENPVALSEVASADFAGVKTGHRVSGVVRRADGSPVGGAFVRAGGRVETTDASGAFSFDGIDAGTHVLTAAKGAVTYGPVAVAVAYGDVSDVLLKGNSFTLSGEIRGIGDAGTVTVTDGQRSTVAVVEGSGASARLVFSLPGVPAGLCRLRAQQSGENLTAGNFSNPLEVTADVSGLIFERDAAPSQEPPAATMPAWNRQYFSAGELADPDAEIARWGVDADPDGDGVVNLLEYAYGLDPLVPGVEGVPVPTMVTVDGVDHLAIAYTENLAATDILLTPQASSDLEHWEDGLIRMEDLPDGRAVYRDFLPADGMNKRFLRVHVTGP